MQFKIHIGPPKTGTSAIQKWCLDNKQLLLSLGVYYPEHDVDENGVSSGNLDSLFDRSENGELFYSEDKYSTLVKMAEQLNAHTVLISSEFLFKKISILAEAIPSAIFVAYIRFELGIIESGYNQSVKRHAKSEIIDISHSGKSRSLSLLNKSIKEYGAHRFVLRAYGTSCFSEGNIITDLLQAIDVKCEIDRNLLSSSRINTSYSLEGLEYKRWFNKFTPNSSLQHLLDRYLQRESLKADLNYSILSGIDFYNLKKSLLKQLRYFCNKHAIHNQKALLEEAENLVQAPVRIQYIGITTFRRLTLSFLDFEQSVPNLISSFIDEMMGTAKSEEDVLRFQVLVQANSGKRTHHPFVNHDKAIEVSNTAKLKVLDKLSKFKRQFRLGKRGKEAIKQDKKVNKHVALLSFHIPFAYKSRFSENLVQGYGQKSVFNVTRSNGLEKLNAGEAVFHSEEAKVIHGHLKVTPNLEEYYPNAIKICWVRDPLERLWVHFNHILKFEEPRIHYDRLMQLSREQKIADISLLFIAMMKDTNLFCINSIYQHFLGEQTFEWFDFVGSIHSYREDMLRLNKLLPQPLWIQPATRNDVHVSIPESLIKYKYLLSDEYELVGPYLK